MTTPHVGVLALQGDVREHRSVLERLGIRVSLVRTPKALDAVDALVIPGGESTTIGMLAHTYDLVDPVRAKIAGGMPTLGTCAGMVLLARSVLDGRPGQTLFGGLDIVVRRNAFGGQVHSFETDIEFAGLTEPVHAVFIRAPWVEEAGPDVEILATVEAPGDTDRIVAVRQGSVWATSFHPEVGGDDRIHGAFVASIADVS